MDIQVPSRQTDDHLHLSLGNGRLIVHPPRQWIEALRISVPDLTNVSPFNDVRCRYNSIINLDIIQISCKTTNSRLLAMSLTEYKDLSKMRPVLRVHSLRAQMSQCFQAVCNVLPSVSPLYCLCSIQDAVARGRCIYRFLPPRSPKGEIPCCSRLKWAPSLHLCLHDHLQGDLR